MKPPQAFGLFIEDRMVCLYTYETDLGDGWEDIELPDTHYLSNHTISIETPNKFT